MTERRESDNPTFYVYEDENGWHKTDKALTDKLNSPTFNDPTILAGRTFYPQWPEPEYKSQTRYAWRITPDGYKVVRNREIPGDGKRHAVVHIPLYLRWDDAKKFWVLVEHQQDQP